MLSPGLSGCENCHSPKCAPYWIRELVCGTVAQMSLWCILWMVQFTFGSTVWVSECVWTVQPIRLWNCHSAFAQISISANRNPNISVGISVVVDTTSTTFVCVLRIKSRPLDCFWCLEDVSPLVQKALQFFRTRTENWETFFHASVPHTADLRFSCNVRFGLGLMLQVFAVWFSWMFQNYSLKLNEKSK